MKKNIALFLSFIGSMGFAQISTNWLTTGNSATTTSYFGTNNAFPINFRTNNVLRASLSATGVFKINNLAGTGNRLLQTDASGNLIFLANGSANQVLYGNGMWGSLPASRLSASCYSLAPFWTIGGDNFNSTSGAPEASLGTCNNFDFIIKSNNTNRVWFKTDGTIAFGTAVPSNSGGKEYKFKDGAIRLSGTNSFGGPMIVFDGGLNPYGDWGIEYSKGTFSKSGLNFWKPFASSNANNYLLYLADDGMIGIGTANPTSRLTIDAWKDDGINIQSISGKKVISAYNKTTSKETFVIKADGKTIIGSFPPTTDTLLIVNGVIKANDLKINGTLLASKLKMGATVAGDVGINLSTMTNGARIMSFGVIGPLLPPSTTCIKPYVGLTSAFSERLIITKGTTATSNVFDFNNDGSNGYIDYGYDNSIFPRLIDTTGILTPVAPVPSLKINSVCRGDVEIAKGGGFVSVGNYFEAGNPIRNGSIVSNINALGSRIAQRVTKKSYYPANYIGAVNEFNTQLFVNRNFIKALSVFNTVTNTNGDETFALFGDGKTQINASVKSNKYFVVNDVSTSTSPNESFIVYGSGKTEIRISSPTATPNALDVVDVLANKINFRVKANGFVYAREVQILNTSLAFPDYVFSKDYKMPSLSELEIFINKNKHLPNFEPASYYETNGINTSEMFVKQQEKIEELTLYIIELEKRMKAIEETIKK